MKQKQKSKELLDRLKKWKDKEGTDEEWSEIINELESLSLFDPAGDDDGGSNPPGHGPGTPP